MKILCNFFTFSIFFTKICIHKWQNNIAIEFPSENNSNIIPKKGKIRSKSIQFNSNYLQFFFLMYNGQKMQIHSFENKINERSLRN